MKISLGLLLIPLTLVVAGSNFYSLSFTRLDGTSIPFSTLQGRKVILFPFNGSDPDWNMLQTVDSFRKIHADSLMVIAFPALDFDSAIDVGYLGHVHDSLGLGLTIGLPGYVKKNAAQRQLPVFQWLTNVGGNTHFNRDVEADGQLFVVSAKGTLYSVIEKQSYRSVLPYVLSKKVWGE